MDSPKKLFFALSLGAALTVAALSGWRWHSGRVEPVETVPLVRADIESTITATGVLHPSRYVDVGAQVSGKIDRLHVRPGDRVSKGQLLVEIDPSVQQAVVDAGRAGLADLQAQLAEQAAQLVLAEHQVKRQRALHQHAATRKEDVDIAESAHAIALARIRQMQARIEQTRATQRAEEARLGYTRIKAPMAGTVVSVESREGQTLNATYQTPHILRIADLSVMTVRAEVSEADVRGVRAGMPVYFTTFNDAAARGQHPSRRWSSTVRQVLPAPQPLERNQGDASGGPAPASRVVVYPVHFEVGNADGELMPQMTAQVAFVAQQAKDVLAVPLSVLLALPGEATLYQARVLSSNGHIEPRQVRIGVSDGVHAQVLDGLVGDDRLVVGATP